MKLENFNKAGGKQRVLVAPLDWGLGHATRCIPIIYELLEARFEVVIAAGGNTKNLLEKEFPNLEFVYLRGYNVKYSNSKKWLPFKLLLQFPKILLRIYQEHQWLKRAIREYKINAVISDNRLGLYHTITPCIYITHQLKIKTGKAFSEWVAQKIHYFFISRYAACWVPDNESAINLAGELSHPGKLPGVPVCYLGPLSRLKKFTVEKKYDCLAIVSGPEPQRTVFEKLLLKEFNSFTGKGLLVRGLPSYEQFSNNENSNLEIINHLPSHDLNVAILQSDIVVCRSGYSSIMDLAYLQQKAILVPTPGQTEQEYLAAYLQQQHIFSAVAQHGFSLQQALISCNSFSFSTINLSLEKYKMVIREFKDQLLQNQ